MLRRVPTLWTDTIAAHRRQVRDAILDTTAALAAEHGLLAVTMSRIAEQTGIGRATLYKYFSGVKEILHAWHDRQIQAHLTHLSEIHGRHGPARNRLTGVLQAYADIQWQRRDHAAGPHGDELAAFLHRDARLAPAEHQLYTMVRDLLAEAAAAGDVRADIAPDELAVFCLHALDAAASLSSKAAVRRLVQLTTDGLQPPA